MTTNLFLVLAVRDICKSEFSEKETNTNTIDNANANTNANNNTNNNNQRNIIRDEGFEGTNYWNRQSSSRCLKFILKPINTKNSFEKKATNSSNSDELLTAFEFNGLIAVPSLNPKSLTGMFLEIRGSLDLCRGILLLQADKCSFKAANTDMIANTTTNAYTHTNHNHSNNRSSLVNDPIVLDEDILNEMIDDDLFEHDSFFETMQ